MYVVKVKFQNMTIGSKERNLYYVFCLEHNKYRRSTNTFTRAVPRHLLRSSSKNVRLAYFQSLELLKQMTSTLLSTPMWPYHEQMSSLPSQ